ncbi:MAG: hypothetical protein HY812_03920 [Planctomycetes bacterium]|nr:hypothetical protein [Planctomycetota bacterium]
MRKPAAKLLMTLVFLGIALVVSEAILRLFAPSLSPDRFEQSRRHLIETGNAAYQEALLPSRTLFWTFRPNVDLGETGDRYFRGFVSNSLGLRNEELKSEKAPGVFRILALGDSCTFGTGVDMEDSYPWQLEDLLNRARPAGAEPPRRAQYQVLNAGVPGYSSFQCLNGLRENGFALAPDLVLVSFGWNDMNVWDDRTDRSISLLLRGESDSSLDGLLSHSALYLALRKAVYSMQVALSAGERTPRVPLDEYVENCGAVLQEAEAAGSRAVFLLWPFRGQVIAEEAVENPYQQALRSFCREQDALLVDLLSAFRARKDPRLFIDMGHLEPAGYRLVAETVAAALREWGLLPGSGGRRG